jgi:hypothetical protein
MREGGEEGRRRKRKSGSVQNYIQEARHHAHIGLCQHCATGTTALLCLWSMINRNAQNGCRGGYFSKSQCIFKTVSGARI